MKKTYHPLPIQIESLSSKERVFYILVKRQRVLHKVRENFVFSYFFHPPDGHGTSDKPIWRFDFTMVWAGESKSKAEENQKKIPPEFHIECELVEPFKYFGKKDDFYIASSLLLKMTDFYNGDSGEYSFVKI